MRPRTKRERLVAELSSKLPEITEAQIRGERSIVFHITLTAVRMKCGAVNVERCGLM